MIGQNFFNYVDFMINKLLLYIDQSDVLAGSELTKVSALNFYLLRSTVWCCNYRERLNNITIDNDFVTTTKEKDQSWSEWKYGLPTSEVDGLVYVPRVQPDLQYLGKEFNYNPRNKVFFIPNTGQDILDMAREFTEINNFRELSSNIENSLFSSSEIQKYFIFNKNIFVPKLGIDFEVKSIGSDRYLEFTVKNKEFYSNFDIELSRSFKFPKLKWGSSNEFLLYYNPLEDADLTDDHIYINPSFLIAKANVPRLFSRYNKNIDGRYTEPLVKYKAPDFINNKVVNKSIDTGIKTINSCYIPSDDNIKIFEIVISRLFFRFSYNRRKNIVEWEVDTKLNNKFIDSRDRTIKSKYDKENNLDDLVPSRFNLNTLKFNRREKQYLNSLALMEHSPDIPNINYIEPFIYQPGTLPVNTKWQPEDLEQEGGYPKGIAPTSIEVNRDTIEYKFNFDIKEAGGDFEKLPNAQNISKYNFKQHNLVPTSELIL